MAAGRAQRRTGDRLPGRVGSDGGGAGTAPSLLRPARCRPATLRPRPLYSPPPPSSSSHRLLFHLPAAWAAGTSSAPRRQRRKRWQRWLRHPIWRTRSGRAPLGVGGARQRAPWRPDCAGPGAARQPSSGRGPERRRARRAPRGVF
jgi:hypothetical protein